jgi:NAD(P)-dependent dehydrogenase (short-subunit alcohol dehydrogenase family)
MTRDWNETKAVVTGASRGLGRAIAEMVAERGGEVVMVARGEPELAAAVQAIRQRGGRAHPVVADVGDPHAATAIAARATELLGGVNLLFHNASTLGPVPLRALGDVEGPALEEVFAVNVFGPQRLTNALLGTLRRQSDATVVAISSDAAVEAYPTWGAYGASKAALDHLIRIQAAELEGSPVRLLSVDPGEMDTAMHADAMPDADRSSLARPADVARLILRRLDEGTLASGTREQV